MRKTAPALRRLGEFIEESDERNEDGALGVNAVRGISIAKTVIDTKADMSGVSLSPYKLFKHNEFCVVTVTSRNGGKISLARNEKEDTYIVSSSYVVFRITSDSLMAEYLSLLLSRSEFDRYARFNSWGSARETFDYAEMRRVMIPVPPIEVQRKVVEAWQGLRRMKEENEKLAEPLMQLCRSYLQECKKKYPMAELGPLISLCDERNTNGKYGVNAVRGVNITKDFMPTAANIESVDLRKYKVVCSGGFVFSGMQTGRDGCIRIALSTADEPFLVSPAYDTLEVSSDNLLPEYLHLLFLRPEMDRLGWFLSDSSVRANLDWNRFCEIKIPLPPIDVQQAIVDVYRCANEAKKIAEEADRLSRAICPALVRWAAEGGQP